MTFKSNFVVVVKVGGKVLRESGGDVKLPFGSEYSILLKNLNSVRAMAQISIDGKSAGPWYILGPKASVEIERFNTSGNTEHGNKFKFIERTQEIEDHRGVGVEDGLVSVEFKKEKVWEPPHVVEHHTYHHHDYYWPRYVPMWPKPWYEPYFWNTNHNYSYSGGLHTADVSGGELLKSSDSIRSTGMRSGTGALGALNSSSKCLVGAASANMMQQSQQNEAGITVPGSESDQKFTSTWGFATEPQTEVITLKLFGHKGPVVVEKPVTVDIKPVCQTCGKRSKANASFCSRCGTSLNVI